MASSSSSLCSLLFSICLLSLLLSVSGSASADPTAYDEKVTLSVFYEAFSKESSMFITHQLENLFYDGIIEIVDLSLVPFGNAKLAANGTAFICEHGPGECMINRLEACAINIWSHQYMYFPSVSCVQNLFLDGNIDQWRECFVDYEKGYNLEVIDRCYNGQDGKQYELENFERTTDHEPSILPWVLVDGRPIYTDYRDYPRFVSSICKAYKGRHLPKGCSGSV